MHKYSEKNADSKTQPKGLAEVASEQLGKQGMGDVHL
jgi:hypothetical protein